MPLPAGQVVDVVIRRARAARRRRASAGVLVLVVSTVVALGAVRPWMAGVPEPAVALTEPSTAPEPPRGTFPDQTATATIPQPSPDERGPTVYGKLPVDVVVSGRLLTSAGPQINLAGIGDVTEAYRISGGYVMLSQRETGNASLWFVALGDAPVALLTDVQGLVIGREGKRVAWRRGGQVYIGLFDRTTISEVSGTAAPAGTVPVAFVGEGVLLAQRQAESVSGRYAVWWPGDKDAFRPRWREINAAYGALPDGRTVVAQIPGGSTGQPCLVLLDALSALAVRALSCELPMISGAAGWLSPDGRWLVAERSSSRSVVVDVDTAFGKRGAAVATGPRPTGPGAWTDAHTVVYGSGGYLTRLRVDLATAGKPTAEETFPVIGKTREPVLAVPYLGS